MWPYLWIAFMLGLVVATTVVAMREKKARSAAIKKITPKPIDGGMSSPVATAEDGFGQADPLDSFGAEAGLSGFDQGTFK